MHHTMNDPVDWFALGAWFQDAAGVVDELAACGLQARTLVGGTPAANVATAEVLGRDTRRVAAWVSSRPCPEAWIADFVGSIVDVLADLARSTELSGGTSPATDERFPARVVRAGLMITELRSIADRLHVYAGFEPTHA